MDRARPLTGFTLVELLIVVVILGVLAGIVLPSVSAPVEDAKTATIEQILYTVRNAIELYRAEHDRFPGYDSKDNESEKEFVNHLTRPSNRDGETAELGTAGYPYGPYLRNGFPANPYNDLTAIAIVEDGKSFPAKPDEKKGWYYKPQTGEFRCNTGELTSDGAKVFDL